MHIFSTILLNEALGTKDLTTVRRIRLELLEVEEVATSVFEGDKQIGALTTKGAGAIVAQWYRPKNMLMVNWSGGQISHAVMKFGDFVTSTVPMVRLKTPEGEGSRFAIARSDVANVVSEVTAFGGACHILPPGHDAFIDVTDSITPLGSQSPESLWPLPYFRIWFATDEAVNRWARQDASMSLCRVAWMVAVACRMQ